MVLVKIALVIQGHQLTRRNVRQKHVLIGKNLSMMVLVNHVFHSREHRMVEKFVVLNNVMNFQNF